MGYEDVPLPSKALKRSGALFSARYRLRFPADEDAGETVTSCLKRHLDKHCIRFDNILRTKARRETLLKPVSSAQSLVIEQN